MNRDFQSGFVVFLIVLALITDNQLCNASFKPLYKMSSVAGGGFDDGLDAKQVCLAPSKVKFDRKTENIYISDRINNRIRMFDAMSGKISTIVGNGLVGYSGDGQAATLAHINNPGKVEVSSSSDIYFADTDNHRIRKVFANGTITTIAGCGQFGFDLEEKSPVLAFEARINYPKAVLLSSDEKTLYITDTSSHMIKALSFETGLVSIVAGSLYRDSSSNSTIVQGPISLALSPLSGEVYFVDDDGIKKITNEGKIEMVAGGNSKYGGDGGLAINAGVSAIDIEFLGTSNTLLIADGNNRIRIIGTNGIIETYAGNGNVTSSVDGEKALDSPVTPFGVSTSNEGEVFFAEYGRVSVVTVNGLIRHVAGNGKLQYLGDGNLATQSQLFKPRGVAVSPSGELFISDSAQDTIRKVSSEGLISTIAGGTFPIDGIIADDVNPLNTFLNNPSALEFSSSSGELFLSDSYNFRVRKISKENLISTIANHTSITRPHGIALYNDLVYVADSQSNRVVKVDKNDGSVIIIAGNGTAGYSGDGGLATEAQLFNVSGVAVLPNGEILIADTNNHVIRKVNLNGIIETIAGTGSPGFNGDNILATSAKLNFPTDIEVSPVSSEIIIVDSNNHRIRKIDSNGNITTIAGTGIPSLNSHGKLSLYGSLNTPTTLSISAVSGNVFISDYENRRIRKLEQFNIEKYTLQVLSSGELRTEMIKDSSNLLAVNYNNIAIDFPKESLKNPELSLATSVYKLDNSAKLTSLEKSISSSIVTVAILDSDCNAIANPFSSPLTITFTDLEFNSTSNYSCIAYNPDSKEWTNNGSVYELKSTNSKFTITCKFSTLSSFAVMEIQSGGSNPLIPTSASSSNNNTFRDSGLGTDAIVAIVVSTVGGVAVVGIIMAVVVGILVIVKRKQNLSKI